MVRDMSRWEGRDGYGRAAAYGQLVRMLTPWGAPSREIKDALLCKGFALATIDRAARAAVEAGEMSVRAEGRHTRWMKA